jgi:hypothetical protein
MKVTVHLRPDAGFDPGGRRATTPQAQEVVDLAQDLGVVLQPMHRGAADPYLANSFVVEVPDTGTAERLVTRLQNCEAVEAAYLKPPDAVP